MPAYLFIDGAYFREALTDFGTEWFGTPDVDLDYPSLRHRIGPAPGAQKVFYYDCLPGRHSGETDEAFNERLKSEKYRQDMLRSLPGWHVVEGIVKRRHGAGNTQKEVDILIAVDMLTHSHRRNANELFFIAGDQDFRPLIEAVVREGVYVNIYFDPKSRSTDLLDAADSAVQMDAYTLHSWMTQEFQQRHPLPSRTQGVHQNLGNVVETSVTSEGAPVRLWNNAGSIAAEMKLPTFGGPTYLYYFHADVELVKKTCRLLHGCVEWRAP
jgi:hypothetical protein